MLKVGQLLALKGILVESFNHAQEVVACTQRTCIPRKPIDNLELNKSLPAAKSIVPPVQRKTTLKWSSDGELSAVDMARVLDRISNLGLTQCDLLCDLEDQQNSFQDSLPTTSWLP